MDDRCTIDNERQNQSGAAIVDDAIQPCTVSATLGPERQQPLQRDPPVRNGKRPSEIAYLSS